MITRPEQDRAIAAAWRTALLDAGVGSDEVHLVPFSSADGEGFNHASHNGPGESTGAIELSGLDDDTARARANDLNHPRITVWRGVSPEILMPLLRHELEHFLQWRDGGARPTLNVAAGVTDQLLRRVGYLSLPGHGRIYNLKPVEVDANAAASRLVRKKLGDPAVDELTEHHDPALLRRRPPPEPIGTLRPRLVCFLAAFAADFELLLAGSFYDPTEWLQQKIAQGRLWVRLMTDAELQGLGQKVREAKPTVEKVEQVDLHDEAWAPTVAAVLAAVNRARSVAGLPPAPVPY